MATSSNYLACELRTATPYKHVVMMSAEPSLQQQKLDAYTKFLTTGRLNALSQPGRSIETIASPNICAWIHQHAINTPNETAFLVPEQEPCARPDPAKGWLKCDWLFLSDFIAELVCRWGAHEKVGIAQEHKVAAIAISPAEDMLPPALALISLGYAILPINPHLHVNSITHLVKMANASVLICSTNPTAASSVDIPKVVLSANERLGMRLRKPTAVAWTSVEKQAQAQVKLASSTQVVREPAYYLHSSGSTGLPKLVPWRNTALFAQIKPVVDFMNSEEAEAINRIMFLTKDLFAVIPVGICLKSLYIGKGWSVAFPRESVLEQTNEGLLDDMIAVKATDISVYSCDACSFVRYLAKPASTEEARARQQRHLHFLQELGPIPCGGSRIDRSVVRQALEMGIQIQSTYGTTESGACLVSVPSLTSQYLGRPLPDEEAESVIDFALGMVVIPFFTPKFEKRANELVELLVDSHVPVFSFPGEDRYWATKDVFREKTHPQTGLKLYVYESRMDDKVMLGNGGAIYPANIEERLLDHIDPTDSNKSLTRSTDLLLCGNGRPYPCLISKGIPRDVIAQAIAETGINNSFPAYSPLKADLIYVLPYGHDFPRTIKNTIHRKSAEEMFRNELDNLYEALS